MKKMNLLLCTCMMVLAGTVAVMASEEMKEVEYEWYDPLLREELPEGRADAAAGEQLELDYNGDEYVLELSNDDWMNLDYAEMWVLLDAGEGIYIELGNDNNLETDDEGRLKVAYQQEWVALDGEVVSYYAEAEVYNSEDDWYTYGYVPAEMSLGNDKVNIELVIYWGSDCEEGAIAGWRAADDGTMLEWLMEELDVEEEYGDDSDSMETLIEAYLYITMWSLYEGMEFDYQFRGYAYEGDCLGLVTCDDPVVVKKGGLEVSYEEQIWEDFMVIGFLKDNDGNYYCTEPALYGDCSFGEF